MLSPVVHVERSAEATLAARALDALRPLQRDVLLMSAYQGMSHREIADTAVSRRVERCSLPA